MIFTKLKRYNKQLRTKGENHCNGVDRVLRYFKSESKTKSLLSKKYLSLVKN